MNANDSLSNEAAKINSGFLSDRGGESKQKVMQTKWWKSGKVLAKEKRKEVWKLA